MGAIPLPEGDNAPETIRRLRAIDAEFFGSVIVGGAFVGGDIYSDNWDGAIPLALVAGEGDNTSTQGYAFDASTGVIQVEQVIVGGDNSFDSSAIVWRNNPDARIFFYNNGTGIIGLQSGNSGVGMTLSNSGIAVTNDFPVSLGGSSNGEFRYRNLPTAQSGTAAVFYSHDGIYGIVPQSSTRRHKRNITPKPDLKEIALTPVKYQRKSSGVWEYGFIAEDLIEQDSTFGIWDENEEQFNDYDTRAVIAVLAAKVNRLEKQVKELAKL